MRHRLLLVAGVGILAAVPVAALAAASSLDGTDLSQNASVSTDAEAEASVSTGPVRAVSTAEARVAARGVSVVEPPPPPPPVEEAAPEPEAAAAPAAAPEPSLPPPPPASPGSVSEKLDRIAQCESGGNPDAYNPRGYYGAFQFSLATWHGLGFSGDPRDYTYAEQKFGAMALYNRSGWSPWPHCAHQLGYL